MYAAELPQAGDHLEIQMDEKAPHRSGVRMSSAEMMENHYSIDVKVVASRYLLADCEVVGPAL
jgi:hypothetical protein